MPRFYKRMKRMKTSFKIIIVVVATAFVAVSCNKGASVDAALSQIEKAMEKVEKNKTSMTEADWKALEAELEQPAKVLNDALENNQVSVLKRVKISAVMMRYVAVISEAAMHTVSDSLKVIMENTHLADSISATVGNLQEVFDSDEMKQALEEMQKASEELQKIAK